jgi:hypothetical protein
MTDPKRLVNSIRIASPCAANWDAMTGDDTVRYCGDCKLNVYNISNMTAADAAALVGRTEGRLCVRLYQRSDGTVLTRNCPVGFRTAVRRVTRSAGAVLTAVLGLFSSAAVSRAWAGPQQQDEPRPLMGEPVAQEPPHVKMGKMVLVRRGEEVTISVLDARGAAVDRAEVSLTNLGTGVVRTAEPDEEGVGYYISAVEPGVYTLTVSAPGFEVSLPKTVRVKKGAPLEITVRLKAE